MYYTTIDAPRGVKILEDIMDDSTRVLATVFTLPISVRVTAINRDLADIPRCVACVLFWVHLFEALLRSMVIVVIDEVKKSDASTDINDSMKMSMLFFESMKHITFNVFSCLLFVDSETPSE